MGKILIVDNHLGYREALYNCLSSDGHKVLTAPLSREIYVLAAIERPDLILADPGPNPASGLELITSFAAGRDLRIPVIIMSENADSDFEKTVYEAGAVEVFEKTLPAADLKIKVDQILSLKHRIFSEPQDIRGVKILLIDDETGVRHFLSDYFEKKGVRILTAASGEEGLWLAEKEKPDVILLDIMMPGLDGILTLKKIREKDVRVSVLMMTSVKENSVMKQASELGAFAYILKPFDLHYLELVVMSRISMASRIAQS